MSEDPITAKLHATADAMVWAEEFVKTFYGQTIGSQCDYATAVDEGTMVGWFANAMQTAIDYYRAKYEGHRVIQRVDHEALESMRREDERLGLRYADEGPGRDAQVVRQIDGDGASRPTRTGES